jgi:transcriptional regulator with XRE-family HTH domain
VPDQDKFFRALGTKVRELRKKLGYSQEDMISFGFSARHFQQIEAGRPITVTTMLRLCEVLEVSIQKLVKGLDEGIYDKANLERVLSPRRRKSPIRQKF